MKLKAKISLTPTEKGGREKPIDTVYKPTFSVGAVVAECVVRIQGKTQLKPGESGKAEIVFNRPPGPIKKDMQFLLYEGLREVATGTVEAVRK
jgi:translation elongation factor EF-Tu-like GTPase